MIPKAAYIDSPIKFKTALRELSDKKRIFVDLEFDRNHFQYGFSLCLMQIFDGVDTCYLIDPLSEISIELIFPIFNNPEIEIVCYAFHEDMRLLHHLGAQPTNIFDLATAMRLLNYDTLSINKALATVLEDESYILDKSDQQKSNWLKRPLTENQLVYASEDVIFLPAMYEKLTEALQRQNRTTWLREEMLQFEEYDWNSEPIYHLYKPNERKQFTLREWLRYVALLEYREILAESVNRPSFQAVDKLILQEIAQQPSSVKNWTKHKRIHPKYRNLETQNKISSILEEVEKEIKENKISKDAPSLEPMSLDEKQRYKNLRTRVNSSLESFYKPLKNVVSEEYGEHFANFILSNRKMEEFIRGKLQPLPYQKQIIQETAIRLGLDLSFLVNMK